MIANVVQLEEQLPATQQVVGASPIIRSHVCNFCHRSFSKGQALGGHKIFCTMNPNRGSSISRIRTSLTQERLTYTLLCRSCNKEYSLTLSKKQFNKGKYTKHCTRSCANKRSHSKETRQKIRLGLQDYRKTNQPSFKCSICNVCACSFLQKIRSHRKPCSHECFRKAIKKGNKGGYRQRNIYQYCGKNFDSRWEILFAKRLDDLKIRWERNMMYFPYQDQVGKNRKYYPDFYLPDYDLYVEIKGYANDATNHKMNDAIKRNKLKLIILRSTEQISSFDLSS